MPQSYVIVNAQDAINSIKNWLNSESLEYKEINDNQAQNIDCDISGINDNYPLLEEQYSGVNPWNGNALLNNITNTNLSLIASFTVNDTNGQINFRHLNTQTLNVEINTTNTDGTSQDPHLTLEFTNNTSYGIEFTSNGVLYIHYELKHRTY